MKTRKLILLTLALFSAVVAYAQPSTRIDLTQLVAPPDTSKVNFVITEGDTAYYEYQVPSLSFDLTTDEDAVPGMLAWNSDESTLDVGLDNDVILQTGQEMVYYVNNQTGSTINDGQVVQFSGSLGNSGRLLIALARADTTSEAKYIMGIATEEIANGADGFVTAFGKIRQIDTDGSVCSETWNDGDILYLSATTAGCLTKTPPSEPSLRIPIAAVVHAANNGTLFVRPTYYPKLDDLHNVTTDGATNGQALIYNSSSGVWEPGSASGGSGTGWLKDSLQAGDVTIDANQNDFWIQDLNRMRYNVDTFELLNLNATMLFPNVGFSSFGNHLNRIRTGRLLRWQSDSPFKSRNYLAISEPFDYVTLNGGLGIDSLGRFQAGVTSSAPHIAGPQGGLDGYVGYSAADSTLSVYYDSAWRPLAWRSQTGAGSAGWLKDSLAAGDVTIPMNRNQLSFTTDIPFTGGTDTLISLSSARSDVNITPYFLSFNFGSNSAGFVENDSQIAFYNTVNGEGLGYAGNYFNSTPTTLLKPRQIPDIQTVRRIVSDSIGTGGVFESVGGVTRSTAANTDDFVFGSSQLDDSGVTAEDTRFFFDKSLSAFYAGTWQSAIIDTRGAYSVGLGLNTTATAIYSAVLGGSGNNATAGAAVVVNGQNNDVTGTYSSVVGGTNHDVAGSFNFVGNGNDNNTEADVSYSFIGGGADLDLFGDSDYSGLPAGRQNTIDESDYALIAGGYLNDIDTASYAVIGGGVNNNIEGGGIYSSILGGTGNNVRRNSIYSSILGGSGNETLDAGDWSIVSGEDGQAALPWSRVHSASNFRIRGDAQTMTLIARGAVTGTGISTLGLGGNTSNTLTVPENSAWSYKSNCIMTVINPGTGTAEQGDSRSQHNAGLITNIGGTMYHSGTIQNSFIDDDADMLNATTVFLADGSNDALQIIIQGPQAASGSATTITWAVCTLEVTQVIWDGL